MEQQIENALAKVTEHLSLIEREALIKELVENINWMITHNFSGLVQVLYRMDVEEKKLRALLQQHNDTDAAPIIATLMMERQVQKIRSRQQFRSNTDIPEEDKW